MKFRTRTTLALGVALLLHSVLFVWLGFKTHVVEVSLPSGQISTHLSMAEPAPNPQPQVSKPQPKKVSAPKKAVTRPSPRAVEKVAAKPKPKTPSSSSASAKATADKSASSRGGVNSKVSQDEMHRYTRRVARLIDRKKRYPRIAKENGEQGIVLVKLVLNRQGQLLGYRLVKKTPYERLAQATVKTVQAVAPFPPLPASYSKPKVTIEVPVRFRLARAR